MIPDGVTVLTEKQLLSQVIGNTMTGGNKWFEYFDPSGKELKKGRLRGEWLQTELYEASWEVHKSLLCRKFDDARLAAKYDGCFTIALDGNEVTMYKDNGLSLRRPLRANTNTFGKSRKSVRHNFEETERRP